MSSGGGGRSKESQSRSHDISERTTTAMPDWGVEPRLCLLFAWDADPENNVSDNTDAPCKRRCAKKHSPHPSRKRRAFTQGGTYTADGAIFRALQVSELLPRFTSEELFDRRHDFNS